MRCFIAVDTDTKLNSKVEALQRGLAGLDTKLVETHNLHFTLKFLGEVNDKLLESVRIALEQVTRKYQPFTINIENTGVFPSEKFIRVVWFGAQELTNLQASVNDSLAGFFKNEKKREKGTKRKPAAHLTIARVRSQKYRKEIIAFVNKHKNDNIGQMLVKEVKLKKSTATPKGPVYEDIAVFELEK